MNGEMNKIKSDRMGRVLREIVVEREYQDGKWGTIEEVSERRTATDFVAILAEEVGELAEASLEYHFGPPESSSKGLDIRDEAVQVAAVAVAFCEYIEHMEGRDDG